MEIRNCTLCYGDNDEGRCAVCGGRVPPRRRRFCSTICSHRFAQNHVWSTARMVKLAAAGYACEDETCDRTELDAEIEVHHLRAPVGGRKRYAMGCHNHQDRLAVLCGDHHLNETRWERAAGRPTQLELPVRQLVS